MAAKHDARQKVDDVKEWTKLKDYCGLKTKVQNHWHVYLLRKNTRKERKKRRNKE